MEPIKISADQFLLILLIILSIILLGPYVDFNFSFQQEEVIQNKPISLPTASPTEPDLNEVEKLLD